MGAYEEAGSVDHTALSSLRRGGGPKERRRDPPFPRTPPFLSFLTPAFQPRGFMSVEETVRWPGEGVIAAVSHDGMTVTVERASELFHVGMFLIHATLGRRDDMVDETHRAILEVREISADGSQFSVHPRITEPHWWIGERFLVGPRDLPADVTDFAMVDCLNQLGFMWADFTNPRMAEPAYRREVLITGAFKGRDDGRPNFYHDAFGMWKDELNLFMNQCEVVGLTSPSRPGSSAVVERLRAIMTIISRSLELDYSQRVLEWTLEERPADRFYSAWDTVLGTAPTKMCPASSFVTYFLKHAGAARLRHRKSAVYEPVFSVVDVWKPAEDNPTCEEMGCSSPAAFGRIRAHRARCEAHRALGDMDCRLVDDPLVPGRKRMLPTERETRTVQTRAWCPAIRGGVVLTVNKWMHNMIDPDTQFELWDQFMAHYSSGVAAAERFLVNSSRPQFPDYEPDPHLFSYQNGMYNVATNVFMEYGKGGVPTNVACLNHIDQYFDPIWTSMPLEHLKVPGYDEIVSIQLDPEAGRWLDAFLGRLFFRVNERDGWEKFPVIKGYAATGKTTIVKAICALYGHTNVGNIAADCEEQWALGTVYDKFIAVTSELNKMWPFPTQVLLSMISGEKVSIHLKGIMALDMEWSLPFLAVGNEEPAAWTSNAGGALARRIIPFYFETPPKTQTPDIQARFLKSLGIFQARICRTYLHMVNFVETSGFSMDACLPDRLKQAKATFQQSTQPLINFLRTSPTIHVAEADLLNALASTAFPPPPPYHNHTLERFRDLQATWRVRLTDLQAAFKEWWNANSMRGPAPSITAKTAWSAAVHEMRVTVRLEDGGRTPYMYGVQILEQDGARGGGGAAGREVGFAFAT